MNQTTSDLTRVQAVLIVETKVGPNNWRTELEPVENLVNSANVMVPLHGRSVWVPTTFNWNVHCTHNRPCTTLRFTVFALGYSNGLKQTSWRSWATYQLGADNLYHRQQDFSRHLTNTSK